MADVSYEQMLGELQALLGQPVVVTLVLVIAGVDRPLALLAGNLRRAKDADLSILPDGQRTPYASGESVLFMVGDPAEGSSSLFVLRKADFEFGLKRDDGDLSFMVGRVRVAIFPPSDPPKGMPPAP